MRKKYLCIIFLVFFVSCTPIKVLDMIITKVGKQKENVYTTFKKLRFPTHLMAPSDFYLNWHNDKKHRYYVLRNNGNSENLLLLVHGGAFEREFIQQLQVDFLVDLKRKNTLEYDNIIIDYKGKKYPKQNIDLDSFLTFIENKYKKIIIVGDSSGASLILSVLLKRQSENKKMPNALVLLSPFADLSNRVKSRFKNFKKDILLGKTMYVKALLNNGYADKKDYKNIYVSPIYAKYKNFPPTLIQYGKDEILADDSIIICNKINKDNKNCTLEAYDDVIHVFQYLKFFKEKRNMALDNINKYILKIFGSLDDKRIKNK